MRKSGARRGLCTPLKYLLLTLCFLPSGVYMYFFQQRMDNLFAQRASWEQLIAEYREESALDKWLQGQRKKLPARGVEPAFCASVAEQSFHMPDRNSPLEQKVAIFLHDRHKAQHQFHFEKREENGGNTVLYRQESPVILWEHELRSVVRQIEQADLGAYCTKCFIGRCEKGVMLSLNMRQNLQ